jgi:hypothetical protein
MLLKILRTKKINPSYNSNKYDFKSLNWQSIKGARMKGLYIFSSAQPLTTHYRFNNPDSELDLD